MEPPRELLARPNQASAAIDAPPAPSYRRASSAIGLYWAFVGSLTRPLMGSTPRQNAKTKR